MGMYPDINMVIGYIVEHMEEELFDWCRLEYQHIQSTIGKDKFFITNIPKLYQNEQWISNNTNIFNEQTMKLFPLERICLLDSESDTLLSPQDADKFDYILAGGILGDVDENDPDRTRELRQLGFSTRNLGHEQMTTDTAIITSWNILDNHIPFDKLLFIDRPTFNLNKYESMYMPFRYLSIPNQSEPLLPPGMLSLWKSSI